MSKIGIDVSKYDGAIDWDAIKPQIDFAIIRVGYGDNVVSQDDGRYLRNIEACERLGIPHGVYIYSYAKTEKQARSEAQHVLRLLAGRELQMPVYYDLEESANKSFYKKAWSVFAPIIKEAGYRVGVYIGGSQYNNYFKGYAPALDSLWVPRYGNNTGTIEGSKKPVIDAKYDLWQYTSNAGKLFKGTKRAGLDVSVLYDDSIIMGAGSESSAPAESESTLEIAADVMRGKYGSGTARKAALGDKYESAQSFINHIFSASVNELAAEVINGKYGAGETRKTVLGDRYAEVQAAVNAKLKG